MSSQDGSSNYGIRTWLDPSMIRSKGFFQVPGSDPRGFFQVTGSDPRGFLK